MSSSTPVRALTALAVAAATTLAALLPATGAVAATGGANPPTATPATADASSPNPTPNPTTAGPATPGDGPVRVVVTYDRVANASAVVRQVARTGRVTRTMKRSPHLVATVRRSSLAALGAAPHVRSVQLDLPERLTLDSSLPVIHADTVHALGFTGVGSTVAVLDSGVDVDHPFLAGRVVAQYCSSSPSDAGERSLCPDGTTEDDAADVDGLAACATAGGGRLCDHGTHVAGIVAGDGTGVAAAPHAGVAPGARIIAMQVFTRFNDAADCGGSAPCIASYPSDQLRALDKVAELAAAHPEWHVVAANMSLGGGANSTACDDDVRAPRIVSLLAAGVATVIASGNAGFDAAVSRPGCISAAVTVGATDDADAVTWFSNRGSLLDVLAPGASITSSVPDDGWATYDGTSMAAPHVAGALAVLAAAAPSRPTASLVADLVTTGHPVTYASGGGLRTTPRIDLLASVGAAGSAPTVLTSTPSPTAQEGRAVTASGTWADADGGTVTLSASSGTVTRTGSTWSWTATRGDDAVVPVTITATDPTGRTGSVGFTATWTNVAPTLDLVVAANSRTTSVVLFGKITDQGWLDTQRLTVTVDGVKAAVTPTLRTRPGNPGPVVVSYSVTVRLGSRATHTVVVTATDDNGGSRSLTRSVTPPPAP